MDGFDAAAAASEAEPTLRLDMDGYEGPIDVLLALAREQKVDLTRLKILDLADQYLAFIARAKRLRLEIAADYLVMAAWLVYLKSRLLLPEPTPDDEPSGAELAESLAHQLRRLQAMQEAGAKLMTQPRLGWDWFARGMPEAMDGTVETRWDVTLYDLLKAYGEQRRKLDGNTLTIAATQLYSVEDALKLLLERLGGSIEWDSLVRFLPDDLRDGVVRRSALAATFAATLELVKSGRIELRQSETFGPIYLRGRPQ